MVASLQAAADFVFWKDMYAHRTQALGRSLQVRCPSQRQELLVWPLILQLPSNWQQYGLAVRSLRMSSFVLNACSSTGNIGLNDLSPPPQIIFSPTSSGRLHPGIRLFNIYQIIIRLLKWLSRQLAAVTSS